MVRADYPTGLSDTGQPVGTDARLAKRFRELGAQEDQCAVRLLLAVDLLGGGFKRVERVLYMGHVDDGNVSTGIAGGETIAAHHSVLEATVVDTRRQFVPRGLF